MSGSLMGWYQISRTLGSQTTSEFMAESGVISPLNGGDTTPNDHNELWQMLVWEQWFSDENFRFGVGKLTTRTFLNLNRYAVSDREDFFSPMIVNNPVAPFTARNGMGAYGQYFFEHMYLTGMIREADGTSADISFDTIDSGNWEHALELGLTPANFLGLGQGYYRFTYYRTDGFGEGVTEQPAGSSVAASFDQDIGENYAVLFRYADADADFRAFKSRIVLGMQRLNPFGFKYDRIGMAGWRADPTDSAFDSEYGLETFWMLQLAPYLEVSADLQYIFNPQLDTSQSDALFAGLRLRLTL